MIKFITEEREIEKQFTLDDVEHGQFFVDFEGWLCQKTGSQSYVTIADEQGRPSSTTVEDIKRSDSFFKIERLLPIVNKIEF
jgi:hypothetical protein